MSEDDLLRSMEQMGAWVATMTGVKKQLMDAGWSEAVAEQMTLEALRHA